MRRNRSPAHIEQKCDRGNFVGPKEAYVGSKYEQGGAFPRLLFISLDSGYGYPKPVDRTWRAVRSQNMGYNVSNYTRVGTGTVLSI